MIDTGAEANLIKNGLLNVEEFEVANNTIRFTTANGQHLRGGDKNVDDYLGFHKEIGHKINPKSHWIPATFYEADITVDAILGCPWLVQKGVGVFPHLKALAQMEEETQTCILLRTTCDGKIPKKSRKTNKVWYWNRRRVDSVGNFSDEDDEKNRWKRLKKLRLKMPRDVGHQRGFSHAGTCGNDDQV